MAHRSGPLLKISVAALAFALMTASGAAARRTPDVQAKLTFEKVGYEYRQIELTMVRKGKTFTRKVGAAYFRRPKLVVRDLDADGESEIWVDTYTGGAHCCDQSRFFRWVPSRRTYAGTFHSWGNTNYRAKNLDGRAEVELVSSDDRFAYVFTDFADSFFPLQIWHFDRSRLLDVTSRFPGQVGLDANGFWRTYLERRREGDVRGILAAWLADQYLLGREDQGWEALERARKRGELDGDAGWPSDTRYLRALRAYLVKLGYAP